jgi:2-polyprenyl-3-methyl-5-hydroxy-6-metoxy-1,4-benzoquinol methylase
MSLSERNLQPELMDQPWLDAAQHEHALSGLARINWMSGSAGILWRPIRRIAKASGRPLRVLDIATGGGDIPIRLYHRTRRAKLPIEWAGIDVSPTAVARARKQAHAHRAAVNFMCLDVLKSPLPEGYDVITSSLFLHHLRTEEAVDLLRRMGEAAKTAVLISDLIRSRIGYALAWSVTRVLTSSTVVHVDGPRSVEGAFTMAEARGLAEQAGLQNVQIGWRWPFRFLLQATRSPGDTQ